MDSLCFATIAGGRREWEMDVNPKVVNWFESRGIDVETVLNMGICSGQHHQTGDSFEVRPHAEGNVIVFPFSRKGTVLNEKYRAAGKKFYQKPGGKKLFWNADILDDPALHEGRAALVITEGEMDALSVIQSGNPFVVSVPDGAPPPRHDDDFDSLEVAHDDKYRFILNDWDSLKKIKRIVIAVDDDAPGRQLGEELVRRLGRARCSFITYPEGCKDLNEVLMQHGSAAVVDTIVRAKPYPVSGVYSISQLPPEPELRPVSTGWARLDPFFKPFYPSLLVVTGFAGSGKSSLTNQMVAQLSLRHGWPAAIASFEMRIQPFITDVLVNTYMQTYGLRGGTKEKAQDWLESNFVFIAPEPSEEDDSFDIDWLIERATIAVIRYGIRVLVIDPWNEVEHAMRRGESLTEYTGRAIRALKRFGREFEVMVVIVAHPTKYAANKAPAEVTLYDISDSSHFANKADFGLVVARCGGTEDCVSEVFVRKVRYQPDTGRPGSVQLIYDRATRTFGQ